MIHCKIANSAAAVLKRDSHCIAQAGLRLAAQLSGSQGMELRVFPALAGLKGSC